MARVVAPRPLEAQVQRAIIDRLRWAGCMAVHIPNAGKRSLAGGRRVKAEGMRPGFPDLAVYGPSGRHALLEVKRPGWTPSDLSATQRETHDRLRALGHHVAVVDSPEAAVAALTAAGWPI